ncbi:hypothetical protein D3C80_1746800 [compost metagenome]
MSINTFIVIDTKNIESHPMRLRQTFRQSDANGQRTYNHNISGVIAQLTQDTQKFSDQVTPQDQTKSDGNIPLDINIRLIRNVIRECKRKRCY